MEKRRLAHPDDHYLASFNTAVVRLHPGEAELDIDLDDDEELTIVLPLSNGQADEEAKLTDRSALARLSELDREAVGFLRSLEGWPYEDDALLWLLIVERDNVRLCYHQASVNDEQVVGFRFGGAEWALIGMDPRFRRKPTTL